MNCTDCMSRNGYCPKDCKKTNADRIRSMTDEELASFIANTEFAKCNYRLVDHSDIDRWYNWLKEEVKE